MPAHFRKNSKALDSRSEVLTIENDQKTPFLDPVDEYELEDLAEEHDYLQDHSQWPRWRDHVRRENVVAKLRRHWIGILVAAVVSATSLGVFVDAHRWKSWTEAERPLKISHTIDKLIANANQHFADIIATEENDIAAAARSYRERRGRHPPPHFDKWVAWAVENGCAHMEFMFDQIHEDLEPFWGVNPAGVRADASSWPLLLTVRGGEVGVRRRMETPYNQWDELWKKMLEGLPSEGLPDIDMALNLDDFAHIFVPWEEMNGYMHAAARTRKLPHAHNMTQAYSSYPPPLEPTIEHFNDYPSLHNPWELTRETCPPDSIARQLDQDEDLTTPSNFSVRSNSHLVDGIVANWTASKSPCHVPEIRNLHGTMINPPGTLMNWKDNSDPDRYFTRQFFPLFSSCKIAGSQNDILLPPATSQGDDAYFSADSTIWEHKKDKVFWRGVASGGINNENNWTRFQRHRFASMVNGTLVALTEQHPTPPDHVPGGDPALPYNIALPDNNTYPLAVTETSDLGRWTATWGDAAFVNLGCTWPAGTDPGRIWHDPSCDYSGHWYNATNDNKVPMSQMYKNKYLPDIDGQGYSGRFRSLMDSDSVPFKATIWQEWSHSRLVAWKHFVPMDNTFADLYALVEYFVGYTPADDVSGQSARAGHDKEGKAIADAGKLWAERVMRKEDMLLYMWRVVLEYARVVDDRREKLGFVEDLLEAERQKQKELEEQEQLQQGGQEGPPQWEQAEGRPAEERPAEGQLAEAGEPTHEAPAQTWSAEDTVIEQSPEQEQPPQEQSSQELPSQEQPSQDWLTEERPTEERPAEERPAEERPA